MTGTLTLVTVVTTAPLTVRETATGVAITAKVVGGSGYAPVVGDRVLATYLANRYYLLGKA